MAAKLRKGDKVVVIAGKDKGRQGEITKVIPKDNKAVVAGVNVAIRHQRQTQGAQGGRIAAPGTNPERSEESGSAGVPREAASEELGVNAPDFLVVLRWAPGWTE